MTTPLLTIGLTSIAIALLGSSMAMASDDSDHYDVTITNLTRGQVFTPILVASHKDRKLNLFSHNAPASTQLSALAEGGDTVPLTTLWEANHRVLDVKNSGGLLEPGESITVTVSAKHGAKRINLASMMIPTNDSFIALNNVRAPTKGRSMTLWSPAYDAGSEPNDEACASIPGPVCGGEGGSPDVGGEGNVHISGGIHGIGDLAPATYDWRNPVAKITIKHVD